MQLPYSAHIKKVFQCRCQSMAGEKKAHSSRNIHPAGLPSASEDSPLASLMRLTFQWNSWCCSFCTKGKWKYKASLHWVPRQAASLSPQSVPALDPKSYCHASTILISSDFFSPPVHWTWIKLFPTHLAMSPLNPWRKPMVKCKIRFPILPKNTKLPEACHDRSSLRESFFERAKHMQP